MVGVAVGVCLYSLLRHRPFLPVHLSDISARVGANSNSLRPPGVQRSLPPQASASVRGHDEKPIHAAPHQAVSKSLRVKPLPAEALAVPEPAVPKGVVVENVASTLPVPLVLKTMGYVEKAAGQVEGIILVDNEVKVVHIGDLISGRYRVTKVSPESVDAFDETLVQSPLARRNGTKPNDLTASVVDPPTTPRVAAITPQTEAWARAAASTSPAPGQGAETVSPAPTGVAQVQSPISAAREDRNPPPSPEPIANTLGYVQKADGKVEAVVADGDTVQLVPETPTLAQAISPKIPAQVSTMADAAISSTRRPADGDAIYPKGISTQILSSVIQPASYQAPSSAFSGADNSAPSQLGAGSVAGVTGTPEGSSDPTAPLLTDRTGRSIDRWSRPTVEMKALGYVVTADGELSAILSRDDEIYIVRQGDHFAGRYLALSVSADAVEAAEDSPMQMFSIPRARPPSSPNLLTAAAESPPSYSEDCPGCEFGGVGEVSANVPEEPPAPAESPPPRNKDEPVRATRAEGSLQNENLKEDATAPDPATVIFPTLGYVQTPDGEIQAIVEDGSEVYLVKQGETFADQYRATRVDPELVLAVKAPPAPQAGRGISAQTDSGGKLASKKVRGDLHHPLLGWADSQALHEVDISGGPISADLGVNLLNSSLTRLDMQGQFFLVNNPIGGF